MADNLAVLHNILSYHPEVDAKDDSGWTPLMIAGTFFTLLHSSLLDDVAYLSAAVVSAGQTHAAHELVDAGADVNAMNAKGQTPLYVQPLIRYPRLR